MCTLGIFTAKKANRHLLIGSRLPRNHVLFTASNLHPETKRELVESEVSSGNGSDMFEDLSFGLLNDLHLALAPMVTTSGFSRASSVQAFVGGFHGFFAQRLVLSAYVVLAS